MSHAAIDPRQFRSALGAFTTGVTIVTTRDREGRDIGLTANSFNSVSLEPPLVLWSLAKSAASLEAFMQAEYFAVHILAADQEPLSNLFAKRGADKFGRLTPARGHGGIPLLNGCAARFECRSTFQYEGGDHEIFVGEVITFEHFERPPLVFHGGKYAWAVKKGEGVAPPADNGDPLDWNALNVLLGMAYHLLAINLRPELGHRHLPEEAYWVVNMVGSGEGRSVAQLDTLIAFTGRRVTPALAEDLQRRGYVRLEGSGVDTRIFLTAQGRQLLMEMAAVTKAIEEDAEGGLDYAEGQLLKQLLQRVIRCAYKKQRAA